MLDILAQGILDFWFGPLSAAGTADRGKSRTWFAVDPTFDRTIAKRYGELIDAASMGALDRWGPEPLGSLALIILLDQFPRNIYRGHARAYYYDTKALALSLQGIENKWHLELPAAYAHFLMMPTMHSERLEIQDICVRSFEEASALHEEGEARAQLEHGLVEAKRHRRQIEQFGRFPHRNASLGRTSTAEELSYLAAKDPG